MKFSRFDIVGIRRAVCAAVMVVAAVACAKELTPAPAPAPEAEEAAATDGLTFTARIADFSPRTKTQLEDNDGVSWRKGDKVSINGVVYIVTPDSEDPSFATITKARNVDPTPSAPYKAVYPAPDDYDSDPALPEVQHTPNMGIENAPMYAESETNELVFQNTAALVQMKIKGTKSISKIEISNDKYALWGNYQVVDISSTDKPNYVAEITDTPNLLNKTVTLAFDSGRPLQTTGENFWIVIPEGYYTLRFKITTTDGMVFEKTTKENVAVIAGDIYSINWTPDFREDWFYFEAREDGAQFSFSMSDNSKDADALEYKIKEENWRDYEFGIDVPAEGSQPLKEGDKIYFRVKEGSRTKRQSSSSYLHAGGSKKFAVGGDLMYLLNNSGEQTTLRDYEFYYLFNGNSNLLDASKLVMPSGDMSETDFCCGGMFNNCSGLTRAPKLPATKIGNNCYRYMFQNCKSLTEAPELPAMTMKYACYESMFSSCKKLKRSPALPSTELAPYCYQYMFYECLELAEAPELPATVLEEGCYMGMFYMGYASVNLALKKAPVLNAKVLVTNCYRIMFANCRELNSVTCFATNLNAVDCSTGWLDYVADTGVFTRASGCRWPAGRDGIPYDWTVNDEVTDVVDGLFSVSSEKQVRFSNGNLYWDGKEWKLEKHQYDFHTFGGTEIGLFNWSYDEDVARAEYMAIPDVTTGDTDPIFADDWTVIEGWWVTLTGDEWDYLINKRSDASSKYGYAKINDISGVVLLPDEFIDPFLGQYNEFKPYSPSTGNIYRPKDWAAMEAAGAVFLPAAGIRTEKYVEDTDTAAYWAGDPGANKYGFTFSLKNGASVGPASLEHAFAIRLVTTY